MPERFIRTEILIGKEAMDKLSRSHVAVFGIGGVGGYAVEALVRSGVGSLDLIDNDTVDISNFNRQIVALCSTIGRYKADVAAARAKDINPDVSVNVRKTFFLPENSYDFDFSQYDYVIDAIDTVTAKLCLIQKCRESDTPIISCMGTGNKTDPTLLRIADISKTSVCPLARVMRRELRLLGIKNLHVLYSTEPPLTPQTSQCNQQRSIPGTVSFVPSAAGLIIAGEVIKELINQ